MNWSLLLVSPAEAQVFSTSERFAAEEPTLRSVRLCDASGCYLANLVVDSDQDGVCDADEQMAGTDSFDPASKPSLLVITELARYGELPSFQSQLGQFVVYSESQQFEIQMLTGLYGFEIQDLMLAGLAGFEIQDLMVTGFEIQDLMSLGGFEIQDFEVQDWKVAHEREESLLVAFPVGERADGLASLGISLETLAEHGIDPERDGLTFTLEKSEDPNVPARRVGGLDVRLISADGEPTDELAPLDPKAGKHGDVERQYVIDGGIAFEFADGVTYVAWNDGTRIRARCAVGSPPARS